jgi:hypothetical protein
MVTYACYNFRLTHLSTNVLVSLRNILNNSLNGTCQAVRINGDNERAPILRLMELFPDSYKQIALFLSGCILV